MATINMNEDLVQSITLEPKKKPVLLVTLIILLLSSLSLLAFFAHQNIQLKKALAKFNYDNCRKSEGSKTLKIYPGVCITANGQKFVDQIDLTTRTTPSSTPSATASLPANWKTYSNNTFGFSIKYNPIINPNEITGGIQQLVLIGFGSMKNKGFDIEITTGDTIGYYKNRITDQGEKIDKEEKIIVDGTAATKLTYKQIIVIDKLEVSKVIISKNNRDYIITALASDIDQILSTFKFTDKVSTPSWKTFKNSSLGLQFEYPPTLLLSEEDYSPADNGLGTGNHYYITLKSTNNPYPELSLGGISSDYSEGRGGRFSDTLGYAKRNDDYFCVTQGLETLLINKHLIIKSSNPNGIEYLKINSGLNNPNESGESSCNDPGYNNIGLLINYPANYKYKGLGMLYDKTSILLDSESFEKIISSIKFLK